MVRSEWKGGSTRRWVVLDRTLKLVTIEEGSSLLDCYFLVILWIRSLSKLRWPDKKSWRIHFLNNFLDWRHSEFLLWLVISCSLKLHYLCFQFFNLQRHVLQALYFLCIAQPQEVYSTLVWCSLVRSTIKVKGRVAAEAKFFLNFKGGITKRWLGLCLDIIFISWEVL
jgi:hypothetical protein